MEANPLIGGTSEAEIGGAVPRDRSLRWRGLLVAAIALTGWFVWPTAYVPIGQAGVHFNRFTGVVCRVNESCWLPPLRLPGRMSLLERASAALDAEQRRAEGRVTLSELAEVTGLGGPAGIVVLVAIFFLALVGLLALGRAAWTRLAGGS